MASCAILLIGTLASAQASKPSSATVTKTSPSELLPTSGKSSSQHSVKSGHTSHNGKRSRKAAKWRKRGQQKIDGKRAQQIQRALIREHYMNGQPSGVWDATTQKAMERYQNDNGWQSKTVPDARALIKLGLGPDQEHLLNPESAMTSVPIRDAAASKDAAGSNTPPQ